MNILVTGGAGYVGYSASKALTEKYPEATIIIHDNLSKGRLENIQLLAHAHPRIVEIPWEKSDIRDVEKFKEVLEQYKPEIVVHLAAIVDAFMTNREGKDVECNIVNNIAAVQVAKLCKEYGTHTFIFQSTVSLYSRGENITEDSPKEPISAYGRSKLDAEDAIFALGDAQFKVCALRSATIVGYNPSFRYETIVNMLCIRSLYGIETNIFESALTSPKSYLTLEDEAAGIIFAIENIERLQGNSYNLSSFNTDLQEVIRLIEQGGTKPLFRISKEKTISQQVYTISAEKIRDLGFVPQGDIQSVIAQTQKGLITRKNLLENSQI